MLNNIVQQAGKSALDKQSKWLERKDTLAGLIVLLTFVVSSAQAIDWSDLTSWVPVVGAWIIGIVGVVIHRFTEGSITPKVVEKIVQEAEYIGRHRTVE